MKRTGKTPYLKRKAEIEMSFIYNHKTYLANLAKRKERKKSRQQPDTLLRDIRLYFTYEVPNTYFYLFNFTQVIRKILQQKNFYCPGYSHIYISIGENEKEAIARAYELEDWYRFGIAVLPKDDFFNCPDEKREHQILQTIANGLYDIAELDHLDKKALKEAIAQANEWGLFHERIIQQKENRKFCFRMSSMPVRNSHEEEIYFTLIDRDEAKEYKWKFGQLFLLEACWWFFKITVTNKVIRTKPRARMELVLKGKKKELEMTIESIKNGTGHITIADVNVPIEPWILELEEKLKYTPPEEMKNSSSS